MATSSKQSKGQNNKNNDVDTPVPFSVVVFDPTRKYAAVAIDLAIKLVSLDNGEIGVLSGHTAIVRSIEFSSDGSLLLSSSDDKTIKVWDNKQRASIVEISCPKKPTSAVFANTKGPNTGKDRDTIVVFADKFGDVYSFPIFVEQEGGGLVPVVSEVKKVDEKAKKGKGKGKGKAKEGDEGDSEDEEDAQGMKPIMGHYSSITSFLITPGPRSFLITSDRDEKIRVSQFPAAFIIESFCLGHKEFVTGILTSPSLPNLLVSSGGDGTLRLWDFLAATELHCISLIDPSGTDSHSTTTVDLLATTTLRSPIFVVSVENKPVLYLYQIVENKLVILQTLQLKSPPISATADNEQNLWVTLSDGSVSFLTPNKETQQYNLSSSPLCDTLNSAAVAQTAPSSNVKAILKSLSKYELYHKYQSEDNNNGDEERKGKRGKKGHNPTN
eukprot:TRINITY_DN591_c0_g1_i1.p1 TRINITY_DN591_c0_g1~~TRINITY_DN591_c0_g1_i1.p1  ORF type:complete len:441 (-),score=104.03 TRINITY_DN591_c0_g1_i1:271-1593(-)